MNSSLKRHKKLVEEEDRISSLPRSLIGHILSFLPTKDAVATSVLSATWKEMWTLMTSLYFDDCLVRSPPQHNWNKVVQLQYEFIEFVNRVLLVGRFSCIKSFRLRCVETYHPLFVNALIATALSCKVEQLDIRVPKINSILLPSDLFTCATLVSLKLGTEIFMDVPAAAGGVYLPFLKRVELVRVRFPDDDSITRFLGGCPALDCLKMKRCVSDNVKVIQICNPLLTSLELTFVRYKEYSVVDYVWGADPPTPRIVLDTPFLSHLFIEEDHVPEACLVLEKLTKLASAHIHIHGPDRCRMPGMFRNVAISDLLKGISQVENLNFSNEAKDTVGYDLPMFENMKELVFVVHDNAPFEFDLLERSPQLRFLRTTFDHYGYDPRRDGFSCYIPNPPELELPQRVPNCLLFHLKVIEIVNFLEFPDEVKLVEYFLKNGRVLEKLTVSCHLSCQAESVRIRDNIRILPRASRFCEIELM